MSNLLGVLIALCGAEFVHNSFEVWAVRRKINWLDTTQNGQPFGHWPININNRAKMLALHLSILVIFAGLFFMALKFLNLSDRSLVLVGIFILITNYIHTTWRLDVCHKLISKMISKSKK